jgi:hypothetical protein
MTKDCPLRSLNFWPTIRVMMSSPPPGELGTTQRTGFEGYGGCAHASAGHSMRPSNDEIEIARAVAFVPAHPIGYRMAERPWSPFPIVAQI